MYPLSIEFKKSYLFRLIYIYIYIYPWNSDKMEMFHGVRQLPVIGTIGIDDSD